MPEQSSFDDLLRRVRKGDQQAAAELVRCYEPAIRRTVRIRLRNPRLRSVLDSMDICQSVLASFFVRAAAGQYELATPEQLVKLLVAMANNKLADQARREQADRRDHRRVQPVGSHADKLAAAGASPSELVSAQELLREAYQRFSPEERQLVEWRNEGRDWAAIATQLGSTPVILRKRLSRALDRVLRQLGLDDTDHE
jgi:RNA polymerase sigma-70 factor (ECF subfamily)